MRLPATTIETFNDSLDRCIGDATFFDRFYDRFTRASKEIEEMFSGVSMPRQKRALKASLYSALMAVDDNRPAIEHLQNLGGIHARLGVRPHHYGLWESCLITTVAESPGNDDSEVWEAWRRVLERVVEIMIENRSPR